jgi:hypothetical protein
MKKKYLDLPVECSKNSSEVGVSTGSVPRVLKTG